MFYFRNFINRRLRKEKARFMRKAAPHGTAFRSFQKKLLSDLNIGSLQLAIASVGFHFKSDLLALTQ